MNKKLLMMMGRRFLEEGDAGGEGGGGGPTVEVTTDWRSSLSEDLRGNPALADFKDMDSMAKSFIDTQAHLGNSIRIPSNEAGTEDRSAFVTKLQAKVPELMLKPDFNNPDQSREFFETLGMPKEAGGYEVPTVEGIDLKSERVDFLKGIAHKQGVTNTQFKGFMEEMMMADAQAAVAASEAQQGKIAESMGGLKAEWGHAFDERMGQAAAVAKETGAPANLIAAIEAGQVDAETYKWLHKVGESLGSEGMRLSNQGDRASVMTPGEAESQIMEIMNNRQHPYWNSHHPDNSKALDRMIELQKLAHPEANSDPKSMRNSMSA